MFKAKTILITGGTGSWAQELTKQLLDKDPKMIILLSRGELAQVTTDRKFNDDRLKFIIGDVRDAEAIDRLFSMGIDYVYHCFPVKTKVVCENEVKNIEDVKINDYVFSSDGRLNKVENLISRKIDEEMVDVASYFSNIPITSTSDHTHFVWKPSKQCPKSYRTACSPACNNKLKGECPEHYKKDSAEWIKAGEIQKGDYIAIPKVRINSEDTKYNSAMMRLFGYYLAEGDLRKYAVRFTFNSKEDDYLTDVENILLENFGKKGSRYYTNHNSCTITVCGKDIVKKFEEFGKGAENKIIPSWVFKLKDMNKIEQLLLGYFCGDGCYSNGKMSTVSENLAYQLRLLFGMINIPTGFMKLPRAKKDLIIGGRTVKKENLKQTYQISIGSSNKNKNFYVDGSTNSYKHFITDDYIFYLVKSVSKKKKKVVVYNLSVSGDHTYNVYGYATHNCAALKHVPVCENQPQEAIKTNITGTINVINSAIKHKIKKVIDVSTDKAVAPTNTYGFTKAVGEKLIIHANTLSKDTDFVCIRGGNVLGSNGSVVPLFIDQIKQFNKITVTDADMTRFFLTLPEAITLLFQATENSVGGETFVMNMPRFYIGDLAKVLINHYGNGHTSIDIIGLREGEKKHEVLISEHESHRAHVFNEDYYIMLPELDMGRDYSHLSSKPKVLFDSFSSSDDVQSQEYLTRLLNNGGFLV